MFHASLCNECGDCFVQCPYGAYTREQAISQIISLKNGQHANIISQCITCMACNEFCPKGANPYDLICEMQEKHGVRLIPAEMVDFIDETAGGMPNEISPGKPGYPVLSLCIMDPTASLLFGKRLLFSGPASPAIYPRRNAGWMSYSA